MKKISMLMFRRMCEDAAPVEFSFCMSNQGAQAMRSLEMTSVYPEMSMMFNPNRICFRNEASTICFNRVKDIHYYDESQAFGMVFGIVCGNGSGGEVVYRIIVDKKCKTQTV